MTNTERTRYFILNNDIEKIKDYHDKLFDNLKDLNEKEGKHFLWEFIIIFLYLFASNITFDNLSLGPVSISDTTVIIKILPLIFMCILYSLHSITSQKNEIILAFEIISAERFNEIENKQNPKSFLSRIYKPYDFLKSINNLLIEKPTNSLQKICNNTLLIFLIPLLMIALAPYFIAISMLVDLYKNYMNDTLGILSFFFTLWLYILKVFHIIIGTIKSIIKI